VETDDDALLRFEPRQAPHRLVLLVFDQYLTRGTHAARGSEPGGVSGVHYRAFGKFLLGRDLRAEGEAARAAPVIASARGEEGHHLQNLLLFKLHATLG
jgi:hypothetical protein